VPKPLRAELVEAFRVMIRHPRPGDDAGAILRRVDVARAAVIAAFSRARSQIERRRAPREQEAVS
jgi:hypothetical protein